MIAVIFEVLPAAGKRQTYLDIAAALRLAEIPVNRPNQAQRCDLNDAASDL